jgi:hypothetical protein
MRQINLKNYVGFRIETKITQDRVLDGVKVVIVKFAYTVTRLFAKKRFL